jgi:hypothetical protein
MDSDKNHFAWFDFPELKNRIKAMVNGIITGNRSAILMFSDDIPIEL